jgi:protoporphyrin/coproporphyrin ferrochelatase
MAEVEKTMADTHISIILMTYGSPATLDDVPAYVRKIYSRQNLPEDIIQDVITEFRRRYGLIGGSPLIRITKEQATALQEELNRESKDGTTYRVAAGMRFSPPFIADVVPEIASGANKLVGLIMSPQYSPLIMSGYVQTLENAVEQLKRPELELKIATDWHLQPYLIQALAERVKEALDRFPPDIRDTVPVLLTAHSMPKRVIETEPGYVNDLKETAAAVAKVAGLADDRWMFCYQSAGHTPEEWLKPDFADVMPELRAAGKTHVLIAPVQFLADHLEILYDIEIGAREQAEEHGIVFARVESLNTSPLFVKAMAEVVRGALGL